MGLRVNTAQGGISPAATTWRACDSVVPMVEAGVSQIARMASEVAVDEALLEARFEFDRLGGTAT